MEEKILAKIKENLTPEATTLKLENTYMFKITEAMGAAIGQSPDLTTLSLTSCKLANLKGLPLLPKLETLDISENNLGDDMAKEYLSRGGSTLKRLFMAGNQIKELETFECLKAGKLRQLDLLGCPVASIENYQAKLFEMVESLRVIDGVNKEGKEVSVFDSEEEAEEAEVGQDKEDAPEMKEFIEQDEEKENEDAEKKEEVFEMKKRAAPEEAGQSKPRHNVNN